MSSLAEERRLVAEREAVDAFFCGELPALVPLRRVRSISRSRRVSRVNSEQAQVLAVLRRAADRHGLRLTHRQLEATAGEVAAWLASRVRPVDDDEPGPVVRVHGAVSRQGVPGGPTVGQLNCLVEKARSRALSAAEVERLAAGIAGLRLLADPRGPLELPCGRCGAGVGDVCRSAGRWWTQSHRERVVLWLAS